LIFVYGDAMLVGKKGNVKVFEGMFIEDQEF
jgi:hypothetical protein